MLRHIFNISIIKTFPAVLLLCMMVASCNLRTEQHQPSSVSQSSQWQATQSSALNYNYGAINLIDPKARFAWTTKQRPYFPEWVELVSPTVMQVGEFSMTGVTWRPRTMPRRFDLEVWNGRGFTSVLTVDNACISETDATRTWMLPRPVAAQRFRIVIHSNCGDNIHVILKSVGFEPLRPVAVAGPLFLKAENRVFPSAAARAEPSSELPGGRQPVSYVSDGNPATFWHVDPRASGRGYLNIDLGQPRRVNVIRAKPRADLPQQVFETAYVQSSQDGVNWQEVAQLRDSNPADAEWRTWNFTSPSAARYMRMIFARGHGGGPFSSLAELEFYEQAELRPMVIVASGNAIPSSDQQQLLGAQTRRPLVANTVLRNELAPEKLLDGQAATFWHVGEKIEGLPTLTVDLGSPNTEVQLIRAAPRRDLPVQFFRSATLAGSKDGTSWNDIAQLEQPVVPPGEAMLSWPVVPGSAYQFYRLTFNSGHAGGRFFSLGELEFWGKRADTSPIPLAQKVSHVTVAGQQVFGAQQRRRITANSELRPELSASSVSDGNADTFWHVSMTPGESLAPGMLIIDLESPQQLPRFVKISPRRGNEIQFFRDAVFEASIDGKDWKPVARLRQEAQPSSGEALAWELPQFQGLFRYMRLQFTTGFANGRFLSLSELEFYRP